MGLWKSSDGGTTWSRTFNEQETTGFKEVGSIDMDSNGRIWIGTRMNSFWSGGGEIYYLDSFNYSKSGDATYETKELEAQDLEGAFTEAYQIIADEIISVYSNALNKDNSIGGVDNEIKALEFLNQALFNYEIFTVNREKMRINITDKEFDRKSILKDSILNKSRIKEEAEKSLTQ